MTDENDTPPLAEQLSDLKLTVTEGVAHVTEAVGDAIEDGKRPGNVLDTLSKIVRQAPLGMLLAAFLVGRAVARRRR